MHTARTLCLRYKIGDQHATVFTRFLSIFLYTGAIGHRGGLFSSNGLFNTLSSTQCSGYEDKLIDCPTNISDVCPTQEDAVVFCQSNYVSLDKK